MSNPPSSNNAMAQLIAQLAPDPAEQTAIAPAETRHIVMLIYPDMFPLDMVGPLSVLGSLINRQIHFLWKTAEPFTAGHMTFTPSGTFADCPEEIEVLLLPGGSTGTLKALQDEEVLAFVRDSAARATHVTSVCTGSLILAAAGLLNGRRATTHWSALDALAGFGAIPVKERYIEDGNIITAAGVSAGIDFALHLAAKITNEEYAKALQLEIEYDPAPLFQAGNPDGAGETITNVMSTIYAPFIDAIRQTAQKSK